MPKTETTEIMDAINKALLILNSATFYGDPDETPPYKDEAQKAIVAWAKLRERFFELEWLAKEGMFFEDDHEAPWGVCTSRYADYLDRLAKSQGIELVIEGRQGGFWVHKKEEPQSRERELTS
jgi:hypothetical protein